MNCLIGHHSKLLALGRTSVVLMSCEHTFVFMKVHPCSRYISRARIGIFLTHPFHMQPYPALVPHPTHSMYTDWALMLPLPLILKEILKTAPEHAKVAFATLTIFHHF